MNQRELNRQVARKTGETITVFSRRGFELNRRQPFGSGVR